MLLVIGDAYKQRQVDWTDQVKTTDRKDSEQTDRSRIDDTEAGRQTGSQQIQLQTNNENISHCSVALRYVESIQFAFYKDALHE